MALVSMPHTFVDGPGNTASGEQVMDNLNAILDQVNGGLDNANLAGAFLKLLVDAERKIAWGTDTLTGFSGTGAKVAKNVNHGLGVTPQIVLLQNQSVNVYVHLLEGGKNSTYFVAKGFSLGADVAPAYNCTFGWVAIG